MTTKVRCIIITAFIVACGMVANAQTNKQDVLYLKNGSIIRGLIVQFIPDSTVKIQTVDGSLFVFPSVEIEKILKEDAPLVAGVKVVPSSQQKDTSTTVSIFAGLAIPGSDFANVAETGFTVGIQIHSRKKVGVLGNLSYSINSTSGEVSIGSFIGVLGLKVSLTETQKTDVYLAPLIGFYIQRMSANDASISGSSVAYGGMIGCLIGERLGFGMRIIAANPKYEVGGLSGTLSTSMVHVFIAVSL
jgi:hypothetical protein